MRTALTILRLLLLLLPLTAFGQFGGFRTDQPFLAKVAAEIVWDGTVTNLSGITYRWLSSDVAYGFALTNYPDQMQALKWKHKKTVFQAPNITNSADGFYFNGYYGQNATNTSPALGTSAGLWWVMKLKADHTTVGYKFTLLFTQTTPTDSTAFPQIMVGTAAANSIFWQGYNGTPSINMDTLPINTFRDYGVTWNGANSNVICYVGGAPVATNTFDPVTTTNRYDLIGGGIGTGFGYLYGWIPEVIMFTNTPTSGTVSNLHWYATNKYSFTP